MKRKFLVPVQPTTPESEKITDERVWLDVYVAIAGALDADSNAAKIWADRSVVHFRERFPQ